MPCKELQAPELPDEELKHCLMKRPVERYRHARGRYQDLRSGEKSKRTLNNPRKVLTRAHSSFVSLSARILSRLVESCPSHRSSSTNVSTHCRKRIMKTDHSLKIYYAHLFFVQPDQASNMLMTTAPSYRELVEPPADCLP
jgi:hypothetical protein